MKPPSVILLFVVVAALSTAEAGAHHSVSAEFDRSQHLVLAGTITKVEWTNPHAFFYVDVRDRKTGAITNWACELGSPNMLARLGWTPSTLKVGMTVSFDGTLSRDGSRKVLAKRIMLDGARIVAWPEEQSNR